MGEERESRIRRRAYELWEEAGHRGSAEEHWFRAERELDRANPARPSSADELATRLRSFYETLPGEPVPGEQWDLVIRLEIGPEDDFKRLLGPPEAADTRIERGAP